MRNNAFARSINLFSNFVFDLFNSIQKIHFRKPTTLVVHRMADTDLGSILYNLHFNEILITF